MPLYYSKYTDETSLPYGKPTTSEDILARQQLLKERKAIPIDEIWVAGQGYTVLYEVKIPLTKDEELMLCLTPKSDI